MAQKYIYRKELGQLTELSVKSVYNNRVKWGIEQFRRPGNKRVVRYLRAETLARLKELGVI